MIAPPSSSLRRSPHMTALAYGRQMPAWRDADYVFLTDVDEFTCLRGGDASLKDLLRRLDWPDVLTMAETIFGTGGIVEYEDRQVTAQFTKGSNLTPGKGKSRRGFKSIARVDPRLNSRNHHPLVQEDVAGDLRRLDGASRDFPLGLRDVHHKGGDARGMFDLVTLNHYALRSLESFPVKHARGDAVAEGRIDRTYFRRRDPVASENTEMLAQQLRLKEEIATLRRNAKLNELHLSAVEPHKAKIAELKITPIYQDLLEVSGLAPVDG